jgi:hypothetical protein
MAVLCNPNKLFNIGVHQDDRELTHTRYPAVTGGPNRLKEHGFTFGQVHYDSPAEPSYSSS